MIWRAVGGGMGASYRATTAEMACCKGWQEQGCPQVLVISDPHFLAMAPLPVARLPALTTRFAADRGDRPPPLGLQVVPAIAAGE